MRYLYVTVFLLATAFNSLAQNTIGLPDIVNYGKQTYKAGAQNRQMRQDKNGVLYFANSEGVLTFDGITWKTYPLSNNSIVRCVEFGPDNKLYVGGQDEFGYFSPAENGTLKYFSLKDLLPPEERSFTDIWEIYFYKDDIFFQSSNKIYQLSGKHCNIYKSVHWRFISLCNDQLIAQDFEKGLLAFDQGTWKPFLKASELPADYFATSLISIGRDSAMLTTVKDGVYILTENRITKLRSSFLGQVSSSHISAAQMVNENHIALTTNLDGCYIIDKHGNLVQKFSRKEGLQNNNILDIFLDKEKNIWLGLDNGIDFIAYNNAIKHVYPDYLNEGSGYAATIFNHQLYLGTSNGLYKTSLYNEPDLSYMKGSFTPVANTKGQVWNLSEVNGKLLMGHHDGAFLIEDEAATAIDKSSGFWTFMPFFNVLPSSLMVAGTYQGINFYKYENGKFSKDSLYAYFESARFVCIDNNKIWVAHPYKGIYCVELKNGVASTKNYNQQKGVQSPNGNYIFKIKGRIILASENGLFEYDELKDQFEPSAFYNKLFPQKKIRYLKEDQLGNVWFVFDKIIGVVDMSGDSSNIIYFPELTNKFVSGFEHVYPVDKNNVFIGGERGFYHINFDQYKRIKYPLIIQLTSVRAINDKDSLLFGGYTGEVNEVPGHQALQRHRFGHDWNSFHFEYASPSYAQQANIEYSYYLKGFDERWSEFSRKSEKEYTNLPAGTYSFQIKARNNLGNESPAATYEFTVLPPWYQTYWAYALYAIIFLIGNYRLYLLLKQKFRAQQKRHDDEQQRLLYLHQLELEKTEKQIVKLKNEKLEAEIIHKNTELASVAMHLVQKGEILGKIKDQMVRLKNNSGNEKDTDDYKKIIRVLSDEDKIDKQWEQFTMHFDSVHSDFLSVLKNKFPSLSANELKLSAYLRMNLSTKEIAQLMNISVRGVEISRYRLRKKIQIPTEVNLFDFLLNLHENKNTPTAAAPGMVP